MSTNGVLYVAIGAQYAAEAAHSAASVKAHSPDLALTLFTDSAVSNPLFDRVVGVPPGPYDRLNKPRYLAQTPYARTLYLDTDTYACGDLQPLFTLLDRFDLAAAHGWQRIDPRDVQYMAEMVTAVPLPFAQFNSGVLLYRQGAELQQLFADWARLIQRNAELGKARGLTRVIDQSALREAVYTSTLRVATLTPEYNCRARFIGYAEGEVKILHGRHLNLEQVEAQLNRSTAQRVFMNLPNGFQVWRRSDLGGPPRGALRRLRAQLAMFLLDIVKPVRSGKAYPF
jgi:hypothetical protein